jgi:hypothetical protein
MRSRREFARIHKGEGSKFRLRRRLRPFEDKPVPDDFTRLLGQADESYAYRFAGPTSPLDLSNGFDPTTGSWQLNPQF